MKKLIALSLLLAACSIVYAGDVKYPVAAIPEPLKKDANAVKRIDEQVWEITTGGELKVHKKYAVTVLNEEGESDAYLYEYYDKFVQIRSIEGNLYDAAGNNLKKVKAKDVEDVSAVDDISLIDDGRLKRHRFYYKIYPYTVEYEVELKISTAFRIPHMWLPQDAQHLSVEDSKFTLITPPDYQLHYKPFNYKGEPVVSTDKNGKSYTWEVAALPAIKKEYECPTWNELTTSVFFAPAEFEMAGYKGNLNNWKDFGKFIYDLKKGRDQLPDNIKQKVRDLTDGVTDTHEKVRRLYEFMQQHTRYISIQLGIGGYQPFEASFVASKGYGDCKALSNYMYSLLKEAGVRSLYTLVHAGPGKDDQYFLADFPSNQFNHAILCVPLENDTMWLECTSQTKAAGYMGDFTGNRKALVIDEDGGTLVSTPRYAINENVQARRLNAKLDEEGTLNVNVSTAYRAEQEDYLHGMLNALSPEKVKEYLNEQFELATYEVNHFNYQETKSSLPVLQEQLDLSVSNYAAVTGRRLFIIPNVLNRSNKKIEDEDRRFDFVFAYDYRDIDSVDIEIPRGYKPEALPSEVNISTRYGTYRSVTKVDGNHIFYFRKHEQFSGRFPASEKEAIAAFYSAIYKSDRAKIVFVKEEQ